MTTAEEQQARDDHTEWEESLRKHPRYCCDDGTLLELDHIHFSQPGPFLYYKLCPFCNTQWKFTPGDSSWQVSYGLTEVDDDRVVLDGKDVVE